METNSSREDLFVKTRKPYTITKQREKWTEEEHNKFIEALKLYGRAWQRIEEHISTKTAVQIRSHAQKFFTKLEKEALMKGIPSGQAHEIEIPPPRPKRKPSGPYPRKTDAASFYSLVESMDAKTSKSHCPPSACKQDTEMEDSAPTKTQGTEDNSEDGSRSEVLNLSKAAPSASVSSLNKGPSNTGAFKGSFLPVKGIRENTAKDSMFRDVSKDLKGSDISNRSDDLQEVKEIQTGSHTKYAQNGTEDQGFSKHVPMELPKGNSEKNIEMTVSGQMGIRTNVKPSFDPITPSTSDFHTSSGMSSIHNPPPSSSPFTPLPGNHDAFSTFSSLVMSTLLQNPAVHAAATLAASFWPSAGTDISIDPTSQTSVGGIPDSHINPSPSMAAIAAATVAAASAWWATQGFLPLFHPLHPAGFAFAPAPTTTINTMETVEVPRERKEEEGGALVDPEQSVAIKAQGPSFKKSLPSSSSSSSDSECGLHDPGVLKTDKSKPTANDGCHDSDKATSNKKLGRSSCGSNTPSSSEEIETDLVEKQNEDNDEAKQDHFSNIPSEDTNTKRVRNIGSINESWKEVSEGGRIAFKALFTRGVLPQSFSPTHPRDPTVNTDQHREVASELPVDLNTEACESETTIDLCRIQGYGGETIGKGLLTSENGHEKLKFRRTGFKPYKRCSMEADDRSGTGEENGNKRIRLEGETSVACNITPCFRTP